MRTANHNHPNAVVATRRTNPRRHGASSPSLDDRLPANGYSGSDYGNNRYRGGGGGLPQNDGYGNTQSRAGTTSMDVARRSSSGARNGRGGGSAHPHNSGNVNGNFSRTNTASSAYARQQSGNGSGRGPSASSQAGATYRRALSSARSASAYSRALSGGGGVGGSAAFFGCAVSDSPFVSISFAADPAANMVLKLEDYRSLSLSLAQKPNVTSLSLEGNILGTATIVALCDELSSINSRLTSLNLSMCGLGNENATKVVSAIVSRLTNRKPTTNNNNNRSSSSSCRGRSRSGSSSAHRPQLLLEGAPYHQQLRRSPSGSRNTNSAGHGGSRLGYPVRADTADGERRGVSAGGGGAHQNEGGAEWICDDYGEETTGHTNSSHNTTSSGGIRVLDLSLNHITNNGAIAIAKVFDDAALTADVNRALIVGSRVAPIAGSRHFDPYGDDADGHHQQHYSRAVSAAPSINRAPSTTATAGGATATPTTLSARAGNGSSNSSGSSLGLHTLVLRFNRIGATGIQRLLRATSDLRTLDVRYCDLRMEDAANPKTEEKMEVLLQSVAESRTVSRLLLDGNGLTDKQTERFQKHLQLCTSGALRYEGITATTLVGRLAAVEGYIRLPKPSLGGFYPRAVVEEVKRVIGETLVVRGELRDIRPNGDYGQTPTTTAGGESTTSLSNNKNTNKGLSTSSRSPSPSAAVGRIQTSPQDAQPSNATTNSSPSAPLAQHQQQPLLNRSITSDGRAVRGASVSNDVAYKRSVSGGGAPRSDLGASRSSSVGGGKGNTVTRVTAPRIEGVEVPATTARRCQQSFVITAQRRSSGQRHGSTLNNANNTTNSPPPQVSYRGLIMEGDDEVPRCAPCPKVNKAKLARLAGVLVSPTSTAVGGGGFMMGSTSVSKRQSVSSPAGVGLGGGGGGGGGGASGFGANNSAAYGATDTPGSGAGTRQRRGSGTSVVTSRSLRALRHSLAREEQKQQQQAMSSHTPTPSQAPLPHNNHHHNGRRASGFVIDTISEGDVVSEDEDAESDGVGKADDGINRADGHYLYTVLSGRFNRGAGGDGGLGTNNNVVGADPFDGEDEETGMYIPPACEYEVVHDYTWQRGDGR